MQSMHLVQIGIEIGKILFVKNPQVRFLSSFELFILNK
jgi:hypothetical protein